MIHVTFWRAGRDYRFGILLASLLALLAGPPVLMAFGQAGPGFDLLMSLVVLAAIVSLGFEPHQRLFALLLGIPTIIIFIGGHALSGQVSDWTVTVAQLAAIAFLFGAAALIVRSLFSSTMLTFDSLFGAVCGYLLIGLGWAAGYTVLERFQPGCFNFHDTFESAAASRPLSHLLIYYSFITLTTVGYGDITPVTPAARTLSWLEALAGQFYLAVIVAGLVSMIVSGRIRSDETND